MKKSLSYLHLFPIPLLYLLSWNPKPPSVNISFLLKTCFSSGLGLELGLDGSFLSVLEKYCTASFWTPCFQMRNPVIQIIVPLPVLCPISIVAFEFLFLEIWVWCVLVWISLGLSCLGIDQLFGSVGLCPLPNLWDF